MFIVSGHFHFYDPSIESMVTRKLSAAFEEHPDELTIGELEDSILVVHHEAIVGLEFDHSDLPGRY